MSINIGTVVSLKSNGLLLSAKHKFLSLGGNEAFTTPLMVVVETLFGSQPEVDEETGEEKVDKKGKDKYKCIYFSNKSMKLVENWFHEKELEIYQDDKIHDLHKSIILQLGDTVRFKTVDEESGKKKSFNDTAKKKDSKPLISYTSPALQVIGFAAADKKEPIIDSYTGEKKREKTKKLVKCKFFNYELDKFSEQLFPIESLQKVNNSEVEKILEKVSDIIKDNLFCIVSLGKKRYFGKPKSAHVLSGRFQLVLWNELRKKNEFLWLDEIKGVGDVEDIVEVDVSESDYFPGFQDESGGGRFLSVIDYISNGNKPLEGNFKIVYRNLKEEVISRYIKIKKIIDSSKTDADDKKILYLKAHCFYRDAEREFRNDRILSIRTIENESLNKFLSPD